MCSSNKLRVGINYSDSNKNTKGAMLSSTYAFIPISFVITITTATFSAATKATNTTPTTTAVAASVAKK